MLSSLRLRRFTAFQDLDLRFAAGINVFIGENGTGKTHVLKILYTACDATARQVPFGEKMVRVFLPAEGRPGRLVQRAPRGMRCEIQVDRSGIATPLRVHFSNRTQKPTGVKCEGHRAWAQAPLEATYIPPKEILAHAPGFRSLYGSRYIYFEEIYDDLLFRAYRPLLRGPVPASRRRLLEILEPVLEGRVETRGEMFYLIQKGLGELEFALVAEGLRKIALLWVLVQNGTLLADDPQGPQTPAGYVLFWDEPEANLNPRLYRTVVRFLFALAESGTQVFLATHDFAFLKEVDLARQEDAQVPVRFFAFYHDPEQPTHVLANPAETLTDVHPNAILETFSDLYDRELHFLAGE